MTTSKLTDRQIKFCQLVVDGASHSEAYLQSYNNCKSRESASAASGRLLGNVRVQKEIHRLRNLLEKKRGLTRLRKRQILYDIATDSTLAPNLRIQAISTDNKMMGHDEPEKVEMGVSNGLHELLARIRAKKD